MKWIKITKNHLKQPKKGSYHDWKEEIAEEGFHQCVYCAIHENLMGGVRNFHVEHYRPQSRFADKKNDYMNLFYSCPICNTFKSDDWPNEPIIDHSLPSYPNPSEVDYNSLFTSGTGLGFIEGINVAAKYIQEKLFLNRAQLVIQRRIGHLLEKASKERDLIHSLLKEIPDDAEYRKYSDIFTDLFVQLDKLKCKLSEIPQYKMQDIKKTR